MKYTTMKVRRGPGNPNTQPFFAVYKTGIGLNSFMIEALGFPAREPIHVGMMTAENGRLLLHFIQDSYFDIDAKDDVYQKLKYRKNYCANGRPEGAYLCFPVGYRATMGRYPVFRFVGEKRDGERFVETDIRLEAFEVA